ncbi:muts domain V-domain-containing protein [Durotheca rogersii]|uniref:muts domain V-domain-containing protein n=1 Tax=Durotheca rogersii TaxID=419775 RepID=UPI002220457F|nr:muts domain V-domain-containing protein [Durotheca rogersii]KAI5866832.1 muts domain V-domain-containing protein [Durotheca rogersii]
MNGPTCRRLPSLLASRAGGRHVTATTGGGCRAQHSRARWRVPRLSSLPPLPPLPPRLAESGAAGTLQVRGKKTKSTVSLDDLPREYAGTPKVRRKKTKSTVSPDDVPPEYAGTPKVRRKKTKSTTVSLDDLPQEYAGPLPPEPGKGPDGADEPPYPTVVLQAYRNMRKFENCVLLTRVGGFYELYLAQAEEYAPLLNLKVAQKKTNAGPIPMAGFPFFQLDRFLKALVLDLNCYVAIAEEFPNDPGDKVKSGGLMHDRKVTRVITPGTLIDENFMDPYANNYIMAIHVHLSHEGDDASDSAKSDGATVNDNVSIESGPLAALQVSDTPIGLAWVDISTGQFYTESTTVTSLSSILSRVGPKEVVVDEVLESHRDHQLFSVLAEDKHLITFAPQGEHLPLSEWSLMLESEIPAQIAQTFTANEVYAGSLLLQYVRGRLQNMSMKLQPPLRYDNMSVMMIDKSTMRSLEIKQTIRDGTFRGSLLHAIRETVTKGGARLLNTWLCAPSTSLETIVARQDLVEYFVQHPDLRDEIVILLRRSHDSQRLVQKFAIGRGDEDDLIALANTIQATKDIVTLLENSQGQARPPPKGEHNAQGEGGTSCFASLLSRIKLEDPISLADRIRTSIDEEGLVQQQRKEDDKANQLLKLAGNIVAAEGTQEDASALPKGTGAATTAAKRKKPASLRDYLFPAADESVTFVMQPKANRTLHKLHNKLSSLLDEKSALADTLRERFGAASLTLRWAPNVGHICHIKGVKDVRKITADLARDQSSSSPTLVGSSRSTRAFHVPEWTELGQRIHQTRFEIQAEEQRIFAELRALVVSNLVKLRHNAAVLDELDVLAASFARLASKQDLVRPVLSDDAAGTASHVIIGGRHPTVESGLRQQGRSFTKNDCVFGGVATTDDANPKNVQSRGRLHLITGPNMAGKSTYLRQNALIAILAQVGCYVPADHAALPLADAVFSRVGSADNLYADQSTFMVEMLETAAILRAATPRSLVIMDEVGRGTTPSDGTAVAFAALHYLVTVNRCRTLFATHFHGLADLAVERGLADAGDTQGGRPVEMYCTDIEETSNGKGFIYVHRLRKGVNRNSHALRVARLANLPEAAIAVAQEVLEKRGRDGGAI